MNSSEHIMASMAIFTDTFEPVSDYHLQMVGSHIHWINKLRESIANKGTLLNVEIISKDSCCPFGKWLHNEHTRLHLGHLHRYHECVEKHAAFHIEAGKVAELANKGKYDNALRELNSDSDFSRASNTLITAIFPPMTNSFFREDWKTKLHLTMQTNGVLPALGSPAPDFHLQNSALEEVTLASYVGKRKILNILPSLDVPGCVASIQKFNQNIANLENIVVLIITADLPSIQHCFSETEILHDVVVLSTFRAPTFAADYGVQITDKRLAGLMAPALVVIDEQNEVIYTQSLSELLELARKPDYESIFKVLKRSDNEAFGLEALSESLNILNMDASEIDSLPENFRAMDTSGIDSVREHFRVTIPIANPCYCEIVPPVPKENAPAEYKHAYALLATHKIQDESDETPTQQDSVEGVVPDKDSIPCMQFNLRDISMTGCSIVNQDEELSYFLRPHTIYKNCTIFIPNYGKATVTFKLMSQHKIEQHKAGEFNELIGILFVNMKPPVERVISCYAQELERRRISMLRGYSPK
jgi:thiol peroxidase